VIGIVQVGSQGMADRYTYLPMIGPVLALVWLAAESLRTATEERPSDPSLPKTRTAQRSVPTPFAAGRSAILVLLTILVTLVLAACIFRTRYQLQFWENSEALFRHTIEVTGENPRTEYLMGLSLEHEGRSAEAMVHYRNAISSQPRVADAFYALGRLFAQQGNWTMAEKIYATRLGDDPDDFTAHLGLATTLPHLGRSAEAVTQLQTAIQNCPDSSDALNNLAWTLATSGEAALRDGAKAVQCAERACALTGYRETVMVGTLGAAYAEAGRFDDAVATAQKACALAEQQGKADLLQINQQLLELYRQHQPYREMTGPAAVEETNGVPAAAK